MIDQYREDYMYFRTTHETADTDAYLALRAELICTLRAQIESGQGAWVFEVERMSLMATSYQACMLEKGFDMERCSPEEPDCKELSYQESVCMSLTRKWLTGEVTHNTIKHCRVGGKLKGGEL